MQKPRITNQKDLRAEFWETYGRVPTLVICKRNRRGNPQPQNKQPADTRMAFVDWIDHLSRSGEISEALASRATL